MSPPPTRSRSVTPFPVTIPPPLPPDEFVAKKATAWKVIGGLIGALLAGAVAFGVWKASLATRDDLGRDRAAAAAERFSMRLEHAALRERVARTETSLEWISAQLKEIARATGARPVPPVTTEGATP